MHIQDIFEQEGPTLSFEFFPPKTAEASEALFETISDLETYKPHFVSVTYGAGGTTRDLTHDLVVRLKSETSLDPVPHLTCVCHKEQDVEEILDRYACEGVSNILALGGDPPRNLDDYIRADDDFQHAIDLVKFIKRWADGKRHPDRRGFGIGVAGFPEGHPSTPNRLKEMDFLKAKVDAGADYIVTQLFFNNDDFLDFRDRCALAGIHVPIIAGIMPITSTKGMARMADLAAGSRFPAKLLRSLRRAGDDSESVERVGIHYATQQCSDLLEHGVSGIHFYTLNQSHATREIYASLGIRQSRGIEPALVQAS
ncbi:MAG: methylenetetrahydrofolate reductase [NAD(P)H] [Verrucomicrobiota bacterium]